MKELTKAVGRLINITTATIFSGFVFSTLWGWFVVTTFGLAPINLVAALGVIVTVRYLTVQVTHKPQGEPIKYIEWAKPTLLLVVGYVVNVFM